MKVYIVIEGYCHCEGRAYEIIEAFKTIKNAKIYARKKVKIYNKDCFDWGRLYLSNQISLEEFMYLPKQGKGVSVWCEKNVNKANMFYNYMGTHFIAIIEQKII